MVQVNVTNLLDNSVNRPVDGCKRSVMSLLKKGQNS